MMDRKEILPISSEDSDDFDIEPSDDIFYNDGVDFEKCNEAAKEIEEVMKEKGLRYREAVAVLHKLHTRIDVSGGDVLDA